MFGPWAFGVAMFTVLIMAGSFLMELTRYLSEGANPLQVTQLTLVLLPGVMAKTFPMAMLLSGLLAFGRLSSDSEIVAIKASGVSVARIMVPVACFGVLVAVATFLFNEKLVPKATQQAINIKKDIDFGLQGQTSQDTSIGSYQDNKLKYSFWAQDFNFLNGTLKNVVLTVYDEHEKPSAFLFINEMAYTSDKKWEIRKGGIMTPADGGSFVKFDGALPAGVPEIDVSDEELLAKQLHDLDALPMEAMGRQIDKLKSSPKQTAQLKRQVSNLEFGFWNKVAIPLAALVFGLVGAPLGIRSHRVPASAGFWIAVIIILIYMFLANALSISAQGGRIPAYVASFLPIVIGLIVGGYLIHKRNM